MFHDLCFTPHITQSKLDIAVYSASNPSISPSRVQHLPRAFLLPFGFSSDTWLFAACSPGSSASCIMTRQCLLQTRRCMLDATSSYIHSLSPSIISLSATCSITLHCTPSSSCVAMTLSQLQPCFTTVYHDTVWVADSCWTCLGLVLRIVLDRGRGIRSSSLILGGRLLRWQPGARSNGRFQPPKWARSQL